MESAVLNPVPGLRAVAAEQFRSVGLALRREGLVAGGFLALGSLWIAQMQWNSMGHASFPLSPEAGIPVSVLALLVPMAVWKGEGPAARGYHRAMPVNHAAHAVARSLSGLAWTMMAVAGYFGWLAAMAALTGGKMGGEYAPYQWVVPFTAAAVMYLLGSALTLVTAHPWRWLGGGMVAFMFTGVLRTTDGTRGLWDLVNTVIEGKYGLQTLISGMSPGSPGEFGSYMQNAVASTWLLATWMWAAIAISLFLFAAYRQPER